LPNFLKVAIKLTLLIATLALILLILPSQFGGKATYSIVKGHSMEPFLHDKDFVVAIKTENYHVGDVVIYEKLGGVVVHQISSCIAVDLFCTKGINNKYKDSWEVKSSEILGKYWFKSSAIGAFLIWVANDPQYFSVLVLLLYLILNMNFKRKRYPEEVQSLLTEAVREHYIKSSKADMPFKLLAATASISTILLLARVSKNQDYGFGFIVLIFAFIFSFSIMAYLWPYVFEGKGLYEPYKSFAILSENLYKLDTDIRTDKTSFTEVTPKFIRHIANNKGLPVFFFHDQAQGRFSFYLITHNVTFVSYANSEMVKAEI
jgi:signal peptidase